MTTKQHVLWDLTKEIPKELIYECAMRMLQEYTTENCIIDLTKVNSLNMLYWYYEKYVFKSEG